MRGIEIPRYINVRAASPLGEVRLRGLGALCEFGFDYSFTERFDLE